MASPSFNALFGHTLLTAGFTSENLRGFLARLKAARFESCL